MTLTVTYTTQDGFIITLDGSPVNLACELKAMPLSPINDLVLELLEKAQADVQRHE